MSKTTETNENSEILNSKPQSSKTNQESENNKKLIRSLSPDVDDSLADFKSPNIILKVPPKIINVKKKPGPRSKKKTTTTAPKESTSQPSIESQFFKQQNQFVCPLCFKSFNDAETKLSHAKTCAVKNKVSTRKLLAATELQERQAAERLHIGLPAGPVRNVKKKKPNIKNFMPEGDPDIQLAKALSISLQEMEQIEEIDNAVAMVAEPDDKFIEMSSSLRRSTLQSFGFKTNKPQAELPQDKIKRRKNCGPTILETRTQETREALLTEKIAEIIVGVEQSTQARYVESNHQPTVHKKIKINSKLLKKYYKSDQKLWNYSKELLKNSEYYVNELAEYIQPIESKEQEITDINHEENNTNMTIDNSNDNRMDIDEATEAEDSHHQEMKTTKAKDNSQSNFSNIEENSSNENKLTSQKESENNDQIKSDKETKDDNDDNDDGDADDENDDESDSLKNNFINNQSDKESSVVVAYDWYKMVGSTYGSDIKILLKHDKYIPAHSLVFLARCCNILNDIVDFNKPYDHWKKIIKWPTIDITAATYFLEYLYCGRIINCCISNENNSIDQLKLLAHKYSVKKLFEYIIKKEKSSCKYHGKLKQDDKKNKTINKISDKAEIKINNSSDESADVDTKDKIAKDEYQIIDDIVWTDDFELEQNQDVQYKTPLSRLDLDKKQLTCSPDLFEDSVVYESDATSSVTHQELTKKFDKSSTIINEITTPKIIDETQNVIPDESSTHEILETPLQSKSFTCRRKLSEVYPTKSKSDMTLYIEKIKRITARDINDTDTDGDTPVRPLKPPHKNPFKVKKNEDESFLLVGKKSYDDDDTLNVDKSFTKKIKKSAISMIEDKLLADAGESLEKVQASNENNIDIGELSTEVESNCDDDDDNNLEESMYTKYQKKTLSNSITNYRNDAIKFLENTAEMMTPPSESNSLRKSENNTSNKSDIPETTINLTELSDSEPEKSQDIHHSGIPNDHPAMEVDKVYSPDNKSFKSFQEPSKASESLTDMHTINDVVFDSWSDALPLTQSNFKNSPDRNILTQQNSDSNSSHDTLKLNNDSDTESNHCFTQKLSLSQEVADVFKDLSQKTNTDTNLNAHGLSQSPITLSSSSETSNLDDLDRFDEILKDLPEANKENNFSKSGNPEGGFEISNLLDSPIFFNSKNQTDESTKKLIPSTSKNITFRSSRVIKKHTSCISHTLSDNSDDEIPIASSTRCHSSLASPIITNTSSRVLAVKSKSDGNFTKKLLHKKRESSVLKNNNLSRLTEVITPPLDYANMTSPEIYRELHKYGLKKQKRPKAIKLLTNIYDQLHPFVSDDDISDTSTDNYNDDEPPRKKQCVQNEINCLDDNDDLSQESSSSSSSIVPEEMDLDEDDDDDGPSTISQGTLPIKELFVKYINKNKDVKRDILMYTPVPLEDLYRKLKAEGFNGKLNDFIDFLDSESITFQVKEAKRNNKKKTTKNKKCM